MQRNSTRFATRTLRNFLGFIKKKLRYMQACSMVKAPAVSTRYSSKTFETGEAHFHHPGRPSMDILVRSWQALAKILEKS